MKAMAMLLLLVLLLSLVGLSPFPDREVTQLIPVQLMIFSAYEGGVTVTTEKSLTAWGRDIPAALKQLKAAASGELLLDTVDHVVFVGMEPAPAALMAQGLRPGTAVYLAPQVEDPAALNQYLLSRSRSLTLGALEEEPFRPVPKLSLGQSGLYII